VYVLKIDGEGNKVWEKTYGTTEQDWAEDIAPSPDGGFLVVGNTKSFEYDNTSYPYLLKIDKRGEKVWEKNYAHGGREYAHGVAVSGDGYIIVGETIGRKVTFDGPWYRAPNPWVIMIDDRGDVVWERLYECNDSDSGCYAADIVGSREGGFAITTYQGYFEPLWGMTHESTTFRIDVYGEKIWETPLYNYGGVQEWRPWGYLATEVCDDGFILAGLTLSRIGADGEEVWWFDYDQWQRDGKPRWDIFRNGSGIWLFPYAIAGSEDGTFALAGLTEGPFTGAGFIGFDINYAGVMHIAKFKDPDLAAICPKPIPEPIAEPAQLMVISILLLIPLLLLIIPGLLSRARVKGT
jgi:hypothetical protein